MLTLEELGYDAVDQGEVVAEIIKASAAQKLGQRRTLPRTGASFTVVSGVSSAPVKEGGKKPVSGAHSRVKIGSNKFASIVVETSENFQYSQTATEAIYDLQPKAHGRAFDEYVFGLVTVPDTFDNFVKLSATTNTQTIRTGVDASVDLDAAAAKIASGEATGLALSTRMKAFLKQQRVGATGARVFEIDDDTIDGIPYATFKSNVAVGYLGDWSRFFWGADEETTGRIAEDGIVEDDADVVHNLTQENKVALINEIFQGANVVDLNDFVKLTPAA